MLRLLRSEILANLIVERLADHPSIKKLQRGDCLISGPRRESAIGVKMAQETGDGIRPNGAGLNRTMISLQVFDERIDVGPVAFTSRSFQSGRTDSRKKPFFS